jgi:hypothetical protein
MAEQDDEEKGKWRTNAGPVPRPPGLGGSGMAPRGSVGTEPKGGAERESDLVAGPVYLEKEGKLEGPYFLLRTDPRELVEDKRETKPQEPDNTSKVHFHETDDDAVNRHYQEQGDVMVPDPQREAKRQEQQQTGQSEQEEARETLRGILDDLRAEDRGEVPDTDRYYARDSQEQDRDGRGSSDDDEPKGRGR